MRRGEVAEVDPGRTATGPAAPRNTRGLVERTVLGLGFVLRGSRRPDPPGWRWRRGRGCTS